MTPEPSAHLTDQFGAIDIYLFDQLLRGRIPPGTSILDAGCGKGRNLVYFLRNGHPVYGVDESPEAIAAVRRLAARLAPDLPESNFRVERLDELSFSTGSMGVVVASAVLHFARDAQDFEAMVQELWRVLAPGGLFFSRLASSTGIEGAIRPLEAGWYRLPDGTDRFLVDDRRLLELTEALGGALTDPLKTTNVQGQRCMTTWCARKAR